jgi:Dyp-type peroxidase family
LNQSFLNTGVVMAINLAASLSWEKAAGDDLKMLQNLQGNILKGHGRETTANIFFQLDPAKKAESKRLLRELANFHLTNSHQQLLDTKHFKETRKGGRSFCHCALSFKGYQALGLDASAPTDTDFRGGMKANGSITALKDPPVNTWEAPFQKDIHGVVIVADAIEAQTAVFTGKIIELITGAGGTIVHVQHGKAVKNSAGNGIENFGYVDGRSQPLMLDEDIAAENAAAGSSRWEPAFPLNTALVKDPGATADITAHGSFFVFRKLEQDVRAFKTREQEVADILGLTGEDRELAGAMLVGRFEDGTPVTLSNEAKALAAPQNDFDYTGDAGSRCPFHGHIRKTNPRGSGGAEAEPNERKHLMARRGILYEDVKRLVHPDELPEAESLAEFTTKVAPLLPTGGIGLLFMAYNSVISNQFKFTQQTWANNTTFPTNPGGAHGIDPVIGQGNNTPGEQKLPLKWDTPSAGTNNTATFSGFVKMKGGEYFFSPSLTFFRNL